MQELEKFKEQIQSIQEVDIGDFRRKAVLYINRFYEQTGEKHPRILKQMKKVVLYDNLTDSEEIRENLLLVVDNLK